MPEPTRRSAHEHTAYQLMKVALGEAEADLAIVNGSIVNVYTGEVLTGDTVLIKGDKIAYVGKNAHRSIGRATQVIHASGKTIIPGLIDGHTHANFIYPTSEMMRYAIKGGTTAVITECIDFAMNLGYEGIIEFLRSVKNQPIKIFTVVPAMVTISPVARERSLSINQVGRLLKRKEVIALGEYYWGAAIEGDQQALELIASVRKSGKRLDGHTAGAGNNKLQAYASLGFSSCHEPTTPEEVLERLRLGMFILIREGETRRELDVISRIKDNNINFRHLALATDGLGPWQITADGYMEFVVQKAINLGFNPVVAIQMATINIAQHYALDGIIGGIAPGKHADIVIIPDLTTIKPEYVISDGQVVAKNGQLLVQPRKHIYSKLLQNTIRFAGHLETSDFAVPVESSRSKVKVRVIDQVTDLVTREAILELPVSEGLVLPDVSQDIVKVAAIERSQSSVKNFVGFIRGIGIKHGAMATSAVWDSSNIIVAGANEADMAQAINRIKELSGGIVVCANGKILAELALPVGGMISPGPVETTAQKLYQIQQAATSLGCTLPDIRLTLGVLVTPAIPFLRICEEGLVDLRQNRFVNLIVD